MADIRPWSPEERTLKKRKIDKEADRAAARLGAAGVYMLVLYEAGGGYLHFLDGGTPLPMSPKELHTMMLDAIQKLELSGGADAVIL